MNTWRKDWRDKGFTMAELLIVVAIVAVLAAIAIPIFTNQLEKSREGTDADALRNAYAKAALVALDAERDAGDGDCIAKSVNGSTITVTEGPIAIAQQEADWQFGPYDIAGLKISENSDSPDAAPVYSDNPNVYAQYKFVNGQLTEIELYEQTDKGNTDKERLGKAITGLKYTRK